MPYTKQTWQDGNANYPASATRFRHLEDGVAAATTTAEAAIPTNDTHSGTPGTVALRQTHLGWPIETTNPNLDAVYVVDGAGTVDKLSSWRNEWGALRGTSPYSGWGDSLVRAIRADDDLIGSGAGALATNAFEISDRRTGRVAGVMWGRSWVDGHLTRNGISMADCVVLGAGDPVPAGLPVGTIIARPA